MFNFVKKLVFKNENYLTMEREVKTIGKELEGKSYEELSKGQGGLSKVVGGHELHFSWEVFNIEKNGDMWICIDASGLPTRVGIKPSYQFCKKKDGSVHY